MRMMLGFRRKAPPFLFQFRFTLSSSSNLLPGLPFLLRLCFCTASSSSSSEAQSFTVSHLMNSFGFSLEQAMSASKFISFKTPEKPDLVFAFFQSHGFSKSQILKIIRSEPQLLLSDPQKSLSPKLQFFYSKGVSKPELAKIFTCYPAIMKRSLGNQIIPCYYFLKDFFQSDVLVLTSVKRFPGVLLDSHNSLESNINALRESGVPKPNVVALLSIQPRALMVNRCHFRKVLEEVKEMGFDPSKKMFCIAVHGLRAMSKSTWEKKIDAFKRWGWSEQDIHLAFLKFPWCMMLSQDKIMGAMDFFVNRLGKDSSLIARRPVLLALSLDKRIIPRYSVVQFLLSKGLIDKDFSLIVVFESTEKKFLDKYVNSFKEEAPQLLNLYQRTL